MQSETESKMQRPIERIQQLERENQALKLEAWRNRRKPSGIVAYVLLFLGLVSLCSSIIYSSTISVFAGVALTFWGALLLYVKPTAYVKASLLDSATISSLVTIDQIITDLGIEGKAIYLPPRSIKELKGGTAFIPTEKDMIMIPSIEEVSEGKVFLKNPEGICLTPPGLGLVNLYEDELGKDLTKVDLDYLRNNLPKLLIEDLETAEDMEINTEANVIRVKMTGSIYVDLCKEVRKLKNICGSLGCPLCSSLALAISRTTGKPVIIEDDKISGDNKTIEVSYLILEE